MNEENNNVVNSTTYEPVTEEKKKSKAPSIIIILLAVCLIGVGGYFAYTKFFANPFTSVTKYLITKSKENVNKYNKPYKLSGDFLIETNHEELSYLDKLSLKYDVTLDLNAKKVLGGIVYSEKDKKIFDVNAFIDNNKAYFKLNNIFDKVLYTEYDLSEDSNNRKISEEDATYVVEAFLNAINDALSEEELTKESVSINVNGKSVKVTSNSYIINKDNYNRISKRITTSLSSDDKLIDIIAKYTGIQASEVKKDLGESEEGDFDGEMKLSIYTKGLFNDFVGSAINYKYQYSSYYSSSAYTVTYKMEYVENGDDILFVYDSGDAKLTAEGTKNNVKIKSTAGNQEMLSGSIVKSQDNNYSVTLDYLNALTLKMNIKEEENAAFKPFDVTGAVNVDNLTEEEINSISEKLEDALANSEIYKALMGSLYNEYEPVEEPWNDSEF